MGDAAERIDELDQRAEAVTCRLADLPAAEMAELLAELRSIRGELASIAAEN